MGDGGQPLRVYVIDDDPAVAESTAYLVRALGYQCATFASPEALLAALDGLAPGCILSDLRMPGMTGFDLAAALRRTSIGWPMLLMSSENGAHIDRAARTHGFALFLPKPLDSGQLAAALAEACATLSTDHG